MFTCKTEAQTLLIIASSLLTSAWLSSPVYAAPPNVNTQYLWYTAYLTSVACGQTCHAVGVGSANEPIVVADIGGNNVVEPVSNTAGSLILYGIACPPSPANQSCYAVGSIQQGTIPNTVNTGVVVPITSSASGDTLGSLVSIPGTTNLSAIACPSDSTCYAVGSSTGGNVEPVLVALPVPGLSGPKVQRVTTSGSVGGLESEGIVLQGIACPDTTVCNAVGGDLLGPPGGGTTDYGIIVRFETPSLNVIEATVDGSAAPLSGIACLSTDTCYAAGSLRKTFNRALLSHWSTGALETRKRIVRP